MPPHIGHPSAYPEGDPYAAILPPVCVDSEGPYYRAVFICDDKTTKGTERSGQEYVNPVLMLTGKEYARIKWIDLQDKIADAIEQRWVPREPCSQCGRLMVSLRPALFKSVCACGYTLKRRKGKRDVAIFGTLA